MHQRQPINIIGSDNRRYIIDIERGTRPYTMELSLITAQAAVGYEHFREVKVDLHKEFVERYIESVKNQYEPNKQTIYEIHQALSGATINNHFDYLSLLQYVLPKLKELLQ